MRLHAFSILALTAPIGASYSYSSKSFSSSSYYSNINGKEDSGSSTSESYRESDSATGLDRSGEGRLDEHNGNQVFESVKNCDSGLCKSETDNRTKKLIRKRRY